MPPTDPTELPPSDPPPSPEPRAVPPRRGPIVCGFCECRLDSAGDVMRMSDTARAHVAAEDTIRTLKADLAESARLLSDAEGKIRELTTPKSGSAGLRL